jgi:hypothetical protein
MILSSALSNSMEEEIKGLRFMQQAMQELNMLLFFSCSDFCGICKISRSLEGFSAFE